MQFWPKPPCRLWSPGRAGPWRNLRQLLIVNSTGWVQSNINAYNSQISGIVQARVNAGKHVYTVNMSFLNLGDLSDGLHPNAGGYQKMADNWHGAIRQVISMGWVANILISRQAPC